MSDPATVEIAEMVLCGSINKGIASSIKRAGGRAVGLSGKDDNLLIAKKLGKKIVDEETGEVKVKAIVFLKNIQESTRITTCRVTYDGDCLYIFCSFWENDLRQSGYAVHPQRAFL